MQNEVLTAVSIYNNLNLYQIKVFQTLPKTCPENLAKSLKLCIYKMHGLILTKKSKNIAY